MRQLWLRADGGPNIGIGHLMRSVALAEAASGRGVEATLVTDPSGVGRRIGRQAGIEVVDATSDSAWTASVHPDDVIAFDGYHLVEEMHEVARTAPRGVRRAAIDDFGSGDLPVNVVVCPNPLGELAYVLERGGTVLAGPLYAPVRASFREARRPRAAAADRLLLSFGGADPHGLLSRAAPVLGGDVPFGKVFAVVGPSASAHPETAMELLYDPPDMAPVMDSSDAAVVAAGSTVWEACTLGLPFAAVPVADNQVGIEHILREAGAALLLTSGPTFGDELADVVARLARPSTQRRLATSAMELTDGRGADRVLSALLEQ